MQRFHAPVVVEVRRAPSLILSFLPPIVVLGLLYLVLTGKTKGRSTRYVRA